MLVNTMRRYDLNSGGNGDWMIIGSNQPIRIDQTRGWGWGMGKRKAKQACAVRQLAGPAEATRCKKPVTRPPATDNRAERCSLPGRKKQELIKQKYNTTYQYCHSPLVPKLPLIISLCPPWRQRERLRLESLLILRLAPTPPPASRTSKTPTTPTLTL